MNVFRLLGASLVAGALVFALPHVSTSNSSGPPNGNTGAPGDNTCARCHGGQVRTDAARFQISTVGSIASYRAGERIPMRVELFSAATRRNGFQLTVLNNANQSYGSIERTDATGTRLSTAGQRTYISQTSSGSQATSWDFAWLAPAQLTDTSSAFFYATGMASNANGSSDGGDLIYRGRLALPQNTTAIARHVLASSSVRIFPNPCADAVHVGLHLAQGSPVQAQLYTTDGLLAQQRTFFAEAGNQTLRWAFDSRPAAGTYILRLTAGDKVVARRLVVR